jgi:TRAP-type C4-dicarboxylate transport system permease small subunit
MTTAQKGSTLLNRNPKKSYLNRVHTFLLWTEDSILVALLMLMIGMAFGQILLRNLFQSGIAWGDVLVRILVLWVGLLGAMVASRKGSHISIDLIARYLPGRVKGVVGIIVELFTSLVCAFAAYYSFQLVLREFEEGGIAFAQVPAWVCQGIIPLAFTVISLRYLIMAIVSIRQTVKPAS